MNLTNQKHAKQEEQGPKRSDKKWDNQKTSNKCAHYGQNQARGKQNKKDTTKIKQEVEKNENYLITTTQEYKTGISQNKIIKIIKS